jgi:hypothetical protein
MRALQQRLINLFRVEGPDRMRVIVGSGRLKEYLGTGYEWVCTPVLIQGGSVAKTLGWPTDHTLRPPPCNGFTANA